MELLNKLDVFTLLLIQNNLHNSIFNKLMPFISNLGNLGFVWILMTLFLIKSKKYRNVGIMCACSLILTSFAGEIVLKHLVQRDRPFIEMPSIQLLISKPSSYSFPSGHTASSFAAAWIISNNIKKFKYLFFILAFLIAFSRLYLFVHYPSDVFAGVILGIICSIIINAIFTRKLYKKTTVYNAVDKI